MWNWDSSFLPFCRMSKGSNTCLFGVIRPAADSCDERGKSVKSKPELQPEPELPSELKSEPELPPELKSQPKQREKYEWESKRVEDLEMSDFSMFDDDIEPFMFICARFIYKNKAQIQKDKEIEVAMAEYRECSRNLSVFDAIPVPKISGKCGGVGPLPMTDDRRLRLTPACHLALDHYNAENQGPNFVFVDVVKTTYRPGGFYYITFQAQEEIPNSPVIAFQAEVRIWRTDPPIIIKSCAIKTT